MKISNRQLIVISRDWIVVEGSLYGLPPSVVVGDLAVKEIRGSMLSLVLGKMDEVVGISSGVPNKEGGWIKNLRVWLDFLLHSYKQPVISKLVVVPGGRVQRGLKFINYLFLHSKVKCRLFFLIA